LILYIIIWGLLFMVIFNDQFQRLLSFGRMQVFSAAISSLVQQACQRVGWSVLFV